MPNLLERHEDFQASIMSQCSDYFVYRSRLRDITLKEKSFLRTMSDFDPHETCPLGEMRFLKLAHELLPATFRKSEGRVVFYRHENRMRHRGNTFSDRENCTNMNQLARTTGTTIVVAVENEGQHENINAHGRRINCLGRPRF